MTNTRTYATLIVSRSTFNEIYEKLEAAGYDHYLVGKLRINLVEIGLMPEDEFLSPEESKKFMERLAKVRQNSTY